MTSPAPDTLTDDLARAVRTAVQVALAAGEAIARRREEGLRVARERSAVHARALDARLRAERAAADAYLRPTFSDRWWSTATPDTVAQAYRTAHAWKNDSPVAAGAVANFDDELATRYGIDTAALAADNSTNRDVAAHVEALMTERAERERISQSYTDRGFTTLDDRPAGRGHIPVWDLRQPDGSAVDRGVIDADPARWAVHLDRTERGEWSPTFYCTDPAAAHLTRPIPPLYLAHEDWWWEMAAEHQIAEVYEQFIHNGAPYAVAHVEEEITRHYGIAAADYRGLPDALTDRLRTVNAERDPAVVPDKTGSERRDAATAIALSSATSRTREKGRRPDAPSIAAEPSDTDLAVQWATIALPRDAERYRYGSSDRQKESAAQTITTAWEVEQSKVWALSNAPALAAQFSQSEASANRQDYLTARTELIDEWSTAGRPKTDLDPQEPIYDSRARRARDAEALLDAGVDADIVDARMLADVQQAKPLSDALDPATVAQPTDGSADSPPVQRRERGRSGRDNRPGLDK
ncbi:hypothetical protein [Rhodococcoides fascians]|jgi:hypothetical protein|uniref:hypothetical protein n=1 Tax=Rhodococcoides fascians TaxID=1828 RepID=UPI00068E51EF|nr:hypothetical protein [Rhodococcus fascians]